MGEQIHSFKYFLINVDCQACCLQVLWMAFFIANAGMPAPVPALVKPDYYLQHNHTNW